MLLDPKVFLLVMFCVGDIFPATAPPLPMLVVLPFFRDVWKCRIFTFGAENGEAAEAIFRNMFRLKA